jgi:hypothetical protein
VVFRLSHFVTFAEVYTREEIALLFSEWVKIAEFPLHFSARPDESHIDLSFRQGADDND